MEPSSLFSPAARVLVLAAHPDDEIIGCGALLARLRRAVVVHLTDGAPRDGRDAAAAGFAHWRDYAERRRAEARAALALAGIGPRRIVSLGVADQQASLALAAHARLVAALLREHGATALITHAYEGGHPDHDAAAFAAHAACRWLSSVGRAAQRLIEMAGYHAAGDGVATGTFLAREDAGPIGEFPLDAAARQLKRRMLDCHATQGAALAPFSLDAERLRRAPRYDFTLAPHAGQLHYERYDWGMKGERWRQLAAAALEEMRLCR